MAGKYKLFFKCKIYYYRSTKYLAIDCEMDQVRAEYSQTGIGMNITCKVSVVNELGEVVLDTLVKPHVGGVDYDNVVQDLPGYKSLACIHGIKPEWLSDAPTFESVKDQIMEICGCKRDLTEPIKKSDDKENDQPDLILTPQKSDFEAETMEDKYVFLHPENFDPKVHSTFIGHGVTLDLKVMGLEGVPFLCT